MTKRIWFAITAGAVGLLLVAVLVGIFVSPVQRVLANSLLGNGPVGGPPWAQMWHGGQGNGSGFTLPRELQGLASIPAGQRFAHLVSAQVNLTDQNNQPLTIHVIPGKVTASSATGLTIAANSGGNQTFTLNDQTMIHAGAASAPAATGTPAASAAPKNGDDVVVVTLNNSTTATAVLAGWPMGAGWSGHGGWGSPSGKGQ